VPALRELATNLVLDPHRALEIVELGASPALGRLSASSSTTVLEAPIVLEEDPPSAVHLYLPGLEGILSLVDALAAGGEGFTALGRSPALPEEHRLHGDRALSLGLGALFASLAVEHAALRPVSRRARRLVMARELLHARLSAALFLDRYDLLAAGIDRAQEAVDEAALRRAGFGGLPIAREPVLDSADRVRGWLLFPLLRERLRTRFGNLWYREKRAGVLIREMCEPGGSVVASEIASGLSLPEAGAENLLQSWREERRRFR
jgi:hypothetical protein